MRGAGRAVFVAILLSPLAPIGLARRAELSPGVHADWPVLGVGALAIVVIVGARAVQPTGGHRIEHRTVYRLRRVVRAKHPGFEPHREQQCHRDICEHHRRSQFRAVSADHVVTPPPARAPRTPWRAHVRPGSSPRGRSRPLSHRPQPEGGSPNLPSDGSSIRVGPGVRKRQLGYMTIVPVRPRTTWCGPVRCARVRGPRRVGSGSRRTRRGSRVPGREPTPAPLK